MLLHALLLHIARVSAVVLVCLGHVTSGKKKTRERREEEKALADGPSTVLTVRQLMSIGALCDAASCEKSPALTSIRSRFFPGVERDRTRGRTQLLLLSFSHSDSSTNRCSCITFPSPRATSGQLLADEQTMLCIYIALSLTLRDSTSTSLFTNAHVSGILACTYSKYTPILACCGFCLHIITTISLILRTC